MYLHLTARTCTFNINVEYPVTVILGDSSTGKTALVKLLDRGTPYTTNAATVLTNIEPYMVDFLPINSLIVIDIDELKNSELIDKISLCKRDDVEFILLGRKYLNRLELPIEAIHQFIDVKGVTKNIPLITNPIFRVSEFKNIVTEDSESGYYFFKSIFKSTLSAKGNSNICEYLDEDNIVLFDGLGFGAYIHALLDLLKSNPVYKAVDIQSFEYFLAEATGNKIVLFPMRNPEEYCFNEVRKLFTGYTKSCNNISKLTKVSNEKLLSTSRLNKLLDFYKERNEASEVSNITVIKVLKENNLPEYLEEEVNKLMPTVYINDETFINNVLSCANLILGNST